MDKAARKQERWVFTDGELKQPHKCNGFDTLVASVGEGIFVQVERNGTPTNEFNDGTRGVPQELQEAAGEEESLYSETEHTYAETWRNVYTNLNGDFLGFVKTPKKKPIPIVIKRRYKVLPLSFPFTDDPEFWGECVKEQDRITPIFNRNGYYFDRQTQTAWMEIDGKAWRYGNRESFQYELDHNDGNNRLDPKVYEALQALVRYHVLSWRGDKRLWKMYMVEYAMRQLRRAYEESRLFTIKTLKQFDGQLI